MMLSPDRRPIKRVSIYNGEPTHPRGIHRPMWTLDDRVLEAGTPEDA